MTKNQILNKSLSQKWLIRIRTSHPERECYDGVVICIHKKYIIIQPENNFQFDGIIVIPKKWISGCRDSKYEECQNKIIRQNSAINKIKAPKWLIEPTNLLSILSVLMKKDIWPGIELVFSKNEETDSAFYIGPIKSVSETDFSLLCYDAAGKWEKEYKISINEIFKIEFGDKYSFYFNKYMRSL